MSESTIRIITGLVLIVHGIGHSLAFFPALNISSMDIWNYRSWLLSGLLGDMGSRIVIMILFGLAGFGFLAAGLGVFNILVPHDLWPQLALYSAVIGLLGLFLFWNAFPSLIPNKIGAIVVDLLVLWAFLGDNALSQLMANV